MLKKKVFVSFDYTNDKNYKFLLEAWDANKNFEFNFSDMSTQEIQSWNIARIKAALTVKIKAASHTLVLVGKHANTPHVNRALIGHRNWINFEIHQSKTFRNRLVAVKLAQYNESPEELLDSGAKWSMTFQEAGIVYALNTA